MSQKCIQCRRGKDPDFAPARAALLRTKMADVIETCLIHGAGGPLSQQAPWGIDELLKSAQ